MKYIDTPAGKFQILLNGKPTEFEAQVHSPYTYHNIPITACYEVHLSCNALHIGDIIRVQFEYGNLTCDGGGENRINVVGCIGSYTVGIGAPDTLELTFNHTTHWLPYRPSYNRQLSCRRTRHFQCRQHWS